MCVIVYKPAGIKIKTKTLKLCWEKNKDGGGLMFPKGDRLVVIKGIMKWEEYRAKITKINKTYCLKDVPVVFHFRIKSVGTKTPENTHPFGINRRLGFCHNGTLMDIKTNKKDESDTAAFCRLILKRLDGDVFSSVALRYLVQGFIKTDKMVFMNSLGNVLIINEKSGVRRGGVWFSNDYWEPYVGGSTVSVGYNWKNKTNIRRQGKQLEYCFACGRTVKKEAVMVYQTTLFCNLCYIEMNFSVLGIWSRLNNRKTIEAEEYEEFKRLGRCGYM